MVNVKELPSGQRDKEPGTSGYLSDCFPVAPILASLLGLGSSPSRTMAFLARGGVKPMPNGCWGVHKDAVRDGREDHDQTIVFRRGRRFKS